MPQKTYSQADLAALCNLASEIGGGIAFEKPFITRKDGVWLELDDAFFCSLSVEERIALTGCRVVHLVEELKHGGIYGNGEAKPLLPFPFTAIELWNFDRATSGMVSLHLDRGEYTEEWISGQSPEVKELARVLWDDEAPPSKNEIPCITSHSSADTATNKNISRDTAETVVEAITPPPNETPVERRSRFLTMFLDEEKRGARGALQRLANKLGIDRSNLGKLIRKAKEEREERGREGTGSWTSELVREGKRKR